MASCAVAGALSIPKPLKTRRSRSRVARGVPGVAMAKIVLDQAQVAPSMGQGVAAGMAQHMRMNSSEPGPRRNDRHEIVDGLPRHRLIALGQEQPGQAVLPLAEEASDRSQLIASKRMAGRETTLQPVDPEMSRFQI